ncbi:MAG: DsbA family protein [Pseudomonadota bacterium]
MSKKSNLFFWVAIVSLVASIGVHIYLTNHHYDFKFGALDGNGGLCNINSSVNCNKTTSSSYSELFGIPVSIYGGLVNLALLFFLLAFRFPIVATSTQKKLVGPIKIYSLGIFGTSLIMGGISLFILNTLCPMCTAAYVLSLVTLVGVFQSVGPGLNMDGFSMKVIPVSGLVIAAFAFFVNHNSLKKYGGDEIQEITRLQFEDWQNKPSQNLIPVDPITIHPSSSAKMKIVEFADFLCGHCAKAFPIIHNFVKNHPDVEFSFQAFPLDGECNPAIGRPSGVPCLLARVSQCSHQQNKAMEMQEWIFSNQPKLYNKEAVMPEVEKKLQEFGMDAEAFKACLDDEKTRSSIKEQAQLGTEVGVRGTPSVYINGKKVPPGFSIPLLEKIYRSLN